MLFWLLLLGLSFGLRINEFVVRTNQYLRNFDDGIPRFGTLPAWYQAEFNDSTWQSGAAPIGKCTGTTDLCGVMGSTALDRGSIYIRNTVDITSVTSASLDITYEDCYVAYVNGQEVGRAFAGPQGYPLHSEQTSFWSISPTSVSLDVTSALRVGSNVIAIQVNKDAAQATCSIAATLTVDGSTVIPSNGIWKYLPGLHEPSGGVIDSLYYEYAISTVGTTAQTPGGLSSVPLDPTYHADPILEYMPWIELYNDGPDPLFFAGYYLTNSPDRPTLYHIPIGLLAPGEAQIFIPSGSGSIFEYIHTNFEADAYSGYLGLYAPNGTLLDSVWYGVDNVSTWHSTGRDTAGNWVMYATPTPGQPNTGPTLVAVASAPVVTPAAGMFNSSVEVTVDCGAGSDAWITSNGEEPWPNRGNSTAYSGPLALGDNIWAIRARCFRTGYVESPIVDNTYFVNQDTRGGIPTRDVTIVSLFSDPEKFFFGPYGITFISGGSGFGNNWQSSGSDSYNMPMNRGQAFEVPAHLTFFKNDEQVIDTGLRSLEYYLAYLGFYKTFAS